MQQNETVKIVIACIIAPIVLGCGIFVSSRKANETTNDYPAESSADEVQQSDNESSSEPVLTAAPETVHIDLFSGITVGVVGIFPDIENMAIGGDPQDAVASRITYSFSSVGNFTPLGADVQITADTSSISDFLESRNYIPASLTSEYHLDPLTMRSYLVQQQQFSEEVRADCFRAAAEKVTGDPNTNPDAAELYLPAFNQQFDPLNQSYAGMYGVYCFFSSGEKVKAAFVCPVVKNKKTESVEVSALGEFEDIGAAITDLIESRNSSEDSISVKLQVKENPND